MLTVRSYLFVTVAASISCSGERAFAPQATVTREELLEALTPDLARAVTADGRLELPAPDNTGRSQISAERAGALATGVAKFNLGNDKARLDHDRGAAIAYEKLSTCNDPLYVTTPFERLELDDPSTDAHPLQKALGPFWLVKLCRSGEPQLNVAVSAYSTALGIGPSGEVLFPPIGGNDFITEAIPFDRILDELPSVEVAVVMAASATHRRVSTLPILILPFHSEETPSGARWQLHLESPARVQTATGIVETADVYVSRIHKTNRPGSRTWTANLDQPSQVEDLYVPLARVGENFDAYLLRRAAETRTVYAIRRPQLPVDFSSGTLLR